MDVSISQISSDSTSASDYYVFPCTAFDTGLYDSDSNKIYFSTVFNKASLVDATDT